MTTTTFPSGNVYTDASAEAEATAMAAAQARVTADPTIDGKPAPAPVIEGVSTVKNGVYGPAA